MKLNFRASLKSQFTQESILFLIGMILRTWYIDAAPFWYDEAFTAVLARLPFMDMIRATAGDVHPPLYYYLVSVWAQIMGGYTPFILRQLSAVFAVLSLWQVIRLMDRYWMSRVFRLVVLALVAASPMLIYYAQEARMYSLLVFLVLEIWIQILDRRWWLVAPLTLALLYVHNYGLIYAACLGLLALLRALRQVRPAYRPHFDAEFANTDIPAVLLSFFVPLALYVPWAIYALRNQLAVIGANFWTSHVGVLGSLIGTISLLTGSRIQAWISVALFAVVVGTLPLVIKAAMEEKRIDWLIMALGPVAVAALLALWRPIYLVRGFLASLPAWYLLIAMMVRRIYHQPTILKVTLAGVVYVGVVIGMVYLIGTTYAGIQKYNPLQFNTRVQIKPNVPVIHLGDFSMVNWMASRPDAENVLYLSPCDPLPGELTMTTRNAMGMRLVAPGQLPEEYYLVPYVGNLSNKCQEDQFYTMTQGLTALYVDPFELGEGGIYYHEK